MKKETERLARLYSDALRDSAALEVIDRPAVTYRYAMMVRGGKGCQKSEQRAASLLHQAARMGNTEALFQVAIDYASPGAYYDSAKAFRQLDGLVGKDSPPPDVSPALLKEAYECLAALYRFGRGVGKDEQKARLYQQKADAISTKTLYRNL